jgi:lysophospholipase L1-like esterase
MYSTTGLMCGAFLAMGAGSGPVPPGPVMPEPAKDCCPRPFRRVVILGESTVEGGGWLDKREHRYADILVNLINEVQAEPVEYFNKGIGASVISPKSPGYAASRKPSAIERCKAEVIANKPDLFLLAYGLNDMRAGMDLGVFIEEMGRIVSDVKAACAPVIVLINVYHMSRYDWYPPFDRGGVEATICYNRAIWELARRTGCLYDDVYAAEGRADWLVHQDSVHANRVGSLVIAHEVFRTLATHCSGLAKAVNERNEDTPWTRQVRRITQGTTPPSHQK